MDCKIFYLKALLIAADQFFNALFLGWPDETLSSRAWRWHKSGKRSWPKKLIEGIFFWDKDHCKESFESERAGRQMPPELRPLIGKIMEKTANTYNDFLSNVAQELRDKLTSGDITQEEFDKAMKHIQEELES